MAGIRHVGDSGFHIQGKKVMLYEHLKLVLGRIV